MWRMDKKHFNKNVVITVDDEKNFDSSSKCWIWCKVYAEGDNKVRYHDHVTGKYRGSAHGNCKINVR